MNGRPLRVFVASLSHETNSFSPLPTSLRAFAADILHRAGDEATRAQAMAFPAYGDALEIGAERGHEMIAGLCAWTQPSGPLPRPVYEQLRDELLADIAAAGPLDMVMLVLHGAMMADGYADCEGDILARTRAAVGAAVPLGAILDLHGNVTTVMADSATALVGCKEYPHTDYRARVGELYDLLERTGRGEVAPRTIVRRGPVVGPIGTTEDPMRSFVDSLTAREGRDGLLSVSMMHGFPWSDSEHTGSASIVVHDGSHPERAEAAADDILSRFVEICAEVSPGRTRGIDEILDEAVSLSANSGPVVVADGADNPGGGAACDSTFLLAALIARDVQDATLGMIWDPQAALIASDAGVGARLPLRIGGKVGPMSGAPVDAEVEVLAVRADAYQRGLTGQLSEPLGLAVAVRIGGVDVVINSIRQQVFSPECFTELGVDLAAKRLVVVKSTQHFRAAFEPVAGAMLYCNAPGSLNMDLASLPYRHLRLDH
ncbi:M81 family peptidase [Brevundimonas intermedia]|uniref:Microcystinase C n=1 Tax=Brevundimonas intermedia TaxID=74315 RepID=A0A4Y9S1B4_9CAUL|nr:M81 family metallopeptidase [Brevundimonas intermedia]TFW15124.1 M81 family peptidase [Brevundimonas intermedia]